MLSLTSLSADTDMEEGGWEMMMMTVHIMETIPTRGEGGGGSLT